MTELIITTQSELSQLIDEAVFNALQKTKFSQSKTEPHPSFDDTYLNVSQTSAYLKLAKQSIYQLVSKREMPFLKNGSRLLFDKSELDNWMSQKKKNYFRHNTQN